MAAKVVKRLPEERDLMVGLEIHFQIKGKKLFCDCSTESYGGKGPTFERMLSPTASEMGFYDPAAEYEKGRDRVFRYVTTDNSCLVEADEEPPHTPNEEAIETGMKVASALNCRTMDSVTFMRKVVVDGSNTSGFQRTAVVGFDGRIETSRGPVRISSVCVEEDSARKTEQDEKEGEDVVYSLDRLGIPLLEVATEPDILDGEHAVEVARALGYIVASTGKSRREVDSIRQDVNLSLGYGRVEVKGIQKLSLISKSITHEIERQRNLRVSMDEFLSRGGLKYQFEFSEVKDIFSGTTSKMLKSAFKSGKSIYCSRAPNLSGLLNSGKNRVGKDLSDIAKAYGLGGVLHTDELPAFGISAEEVDAVRKAFKPGGDDALVLLVCTKERAEKLAGAFTSRMKKLSEMDFSETRGPHEDGTTKFLRPLPGKERMYPETDVPVFPVTAGMLERISSFVPRGEDEIAGELVTEFSISRQEARTIASSFQVDEFREYAKITGEGKLAGRLLLQTVPEMEKKHAARFDEAELRKLLEISSGKKWARNVLENAMDAMLSKGLGAEGSAKAVMESSISDRELRSLVETIAGESGGSVKPGALIAKLKERTTKSFDPKKAIEFLSKL